MAHRSIWINHYHVCTRVYKNVYRTTRAYFNYCSARIDGLVKQEETATEMTQSFTGRDDYLYYRHVTFGARTKKFGPTQQVNYRPIVVSYKRNEVSLGPIRVLKWSLQSPLDGQGERLEMVCSKLKLYANFITNIWPLRPSPDANGVLKIPTVTIYLPDYNTFLKTDY